MKLSFEVIGLLFLFTDNCVRAISEIAQVFLNVMLINQIFSAV